MSEQHTPAGLRLPPLGPGWAGALMGSSILATLLEAHATSGPVLEILAKVMLAVATTVFLLLAVGFARHRNPHFTAPNMPAWGMTAMGVLAIGSAYSGVSKFWVVHTISWAVGLVMGVASALIFLRYLLSRKAGAPAFTWGLPLVAPMVAATSSAQLANHLEQGASGQWMVDALRIIGFGCFLLSLSLSFPVFARVYYAVFKAGHLPVSFATTAWIPLGVLGQSPVAAHTLAHTEQLRPWAMGYSAVVLLIAVPLTVWAIVQHWPAALGWRGERMAYNPTWWASTFPVGTLSLGSHTLAQSTGYHWLDVISIAMLLMLVLHYAWAVGGFLKR
ncbi:TDT family transporter [Corynebacterium heidelbergense]|nr:TDT family transporter [Corynebacterium heidelbergense]